MDKNNIPVYELVSTTNKDFMHNVRNFFVLTINKDRCVNFYTYCPEDNSVCPSWHTTHICGNPENMGKNTIIFHTVNSEYTLKFLRCVSL